MTRLVVALPSEAKPLVAHYKLKAVDDSRGFKIYQKDGMALIVSGVGKSAATAATAYLQAMTGNELDRAWINIGMGGHRELVLGEGILAQRIMDLANRQSWYPPPVLDVSSPRAPVLTVENVEEDFEGEWVFEMEAAGFCESAYRFATAELVQSFKIISDNRSVPPRWMSTRQVDELIETRLEEIDAVVEATASLAQELATLSKEPPELETFLERWHFTVSERRRLQRLLRRWHLLAPEKDLLDEELSRRKTSKDVLRAIQARIEALPVSLT
jgi:hypothetical protein